LKAVISVYDKTGIVELGRSLHALGIDLVSTGGTHKVLSESGLPVQQISELTGFPEILGGRVKTLHPAVHGGILGRRDQEAQVAELARHKIGYIDIVVVNLYPFEATISQTDMSTEATLENIDIGGPTMLRAAAKNHPFVAVLVDPADYLWFTEQLGHGGLSLQERRHLAAKAFQHVALYDTIIARWLRDAESPSSEELTLGMRKVAELRYGENPHQRGALYATTPPTGGVVGATQLHGSALSFLNILDADAAWRTAGDFEDPTVSIVKHATPCGLASHPNQAEAYRRALAGDPVSAFGGIVGFNQTVDMETAEAMRGILYDVIVAPDFDPEALAVLRKRRNTRILAVNQAFTLTSIEAADVRTVSGGFLVQSHDQLAPNPLNWKTVAGRAPNEAQLKDLVFAWKAVKHIKSNGIVLVKDQAIVGMGAGQPNRVTSVHLSLRAAGVEATGSVLASDAFFPFPDGVEIAIQGGVTAIVQPGGSIRDDDVIAAAEAGGISMLLTGVRHFRH
jgi:phosphoribosylaminoimidazolecarboxamide formyltransferase/IMP cyclohydrolase